MNRWQKIAWYNIVVILATLSITTITVGVLAMKYGFPKALSGLGFLGTLGLLGLSGIIFKQKKGQTDFDEREQDDILQVDSNNLRHIMACPHCRLYDSMGYSRTEKLHFKQYSTPDAWGNWSQYDSSAVLSNAGSVRLEG